MELGTEGGGGEEVAGEETQLPQSRGQVGAGRTDQGLDPRHDRTGKGADDLAELPDAAEDADDAEDPQDPQRLDGSAPPATAVRAKAGGSGGRHSWGRGGEGNGLGPPSCISPSTKARGDDGPRARGRTLGGPAAPREGRWAVNRAAQPHPRSAGGRGGGGAGRQRRRRDGGAQHPLPVDEKARRTTETPTTIVSNQFLPARRKVGEGGSAGSARTSQRPAVRAEGRGPWHSPRVLSQRRPPARMGGGGS
jgi:hypothetical protein